MRHLKPWDLNTAMTRVSATGSSLGVMWVKLGIDNTTADVPPPAGLRGKSPSVVRTRYRTDIVPGQWLSYRGISYRIDDARDPDGQRVDLVLSCTQMQGSTGTLTISGQPKTVAVSVTRFLDQSGETPRVETRYRLEFSRLDVPGSIPRGSTVAVDGVTYTVDGLLDDDGVVVAVAAHKS